MAPMKMLIYGAAIGGIMFVFLSFHETRQHAVGSSLDGLRKIDPQFSATLPAVTQGVQLMEQRLLSLEVQIQELGRSHSSTGVLLRSPHRSGVSLAESLIGQYKIVPLRFAGATTNVPTEIGHSAEMAIDNDASTRMACKGCIWSGDLGKAVVLVSITIDWQSCDCSDDASIRIEVSGAADGPWQWYSNAGGFRSSDGHTQRNHVMMSDARYVRLRPGESSASLFFAVWDVYVKAEAQPIVNMRPALASIRSQQVNPDEIPESKARTQEKRDDSERDEEDEEEEEDENIVESDPSSGIFYRTDDKCGSRVPIASNAKAIGCNPKGKYPCCSPLGWCGNSNGHCNCPGCKDYRKQLRPGDLPYGSISGATVKSGDTVAVIIPFRDRETHLTKFKSYWKWFAKEGVLPIRVNRWEIFIAEQFDSDAFNRGWNFNVGLAVASMQTSASKDITAEMKTEFKCAVIQDIDYLPEQGVDYADCAVPIQLSSEIDRFDWKVPYLKSAGGIVSMSEGHWKQVNGFSNEYFGWGAEDDELYHRLRLTGLLHGDCQPFCKPGDASIGRRGLSIRRPGRGKGRFSGKSMHNGNHTKRIMNKTTYETNLKLLREIENGKPRWKTDGLSNLEFRIVSYEKDATDALVSGITYHHIKARRGHRAYNLKGITFAIPSSLCSRMTNKDSVYIHHLSDPIPWDLDALRASVRIILKDHCRPPWNLLTFVLVDLRSHLAKLVSDSNPSMLVSFYRGLSDPSQDGMIIVDSRPLEEVRAAFEVTNARIHQPVQYTICTSKFSGHDTKFSIQAGPLCGEGWDVMGEGTFSALAEKKPGMMKISVCDNSKFGVQRFLKNEQCLKDWENLEWTHGPTFWVREGHEFCVGHRTFAAPRYSAVLLPSPEKPSCNFETFQQAFSFSSSGYTHLFGSFSLCIARKGLETKIAADSHCEDDGFSKLLGFRARLPSRAAGTDVTFCIDSGTSGYEILQTCEKAGAVAFSVPRESISSTPVLVCSGVLKDRPDHKAIGIGPECQSGPGKKVDHKVAFFAPSIADIVASISKTGETNSGYPFFTIVEGGEGCSGLFCSSAVSCATRRDMYDGKPCDISP